MARVLRRDVLPAARWASAAARCDSCRPQRWEIAAAMWLAPTGAAGGRTWYVARALQRVARVHWRVAGHQVAVVWSYLGRFLTRVVGELTRHLAHIVRGAFVHVRAVTTASVVRVFTHGRRTGPCAIARAPGPTAKARVSLQTNGALCRGRGTRHLLRPRS